MRITAKTSGSLVISEIPVTSARVSRGAQQTEPVLPPEFQNANISVEKTYAVSLRAAPPTRGLAEGWFRVVPSGKELHLEPATPAPGKRNLLLIHGTFSNAASAFAGLAQTDFFTRMAPLYEDRIYAFNHFTVSKAPRANVEQL